MFVSQIYRRADAFLFGRRTYEIFAGSWGTWPDPGGNPVWTALNTRPKYVASTTLTDPRWADTTVLSGDLAAAVADLKAKPGGELQVHGSGALVRWLLDNQLVDEITLLVCPVVVGQGTRLFPATGPDAALELVESRSTPKGGNDPGLPAHRPPAVRNGHDLKHVTYVLQSVRVAHWWVRAAAWTGARSIAAIAEWAADTPQPVRAALGARRDPLTGRWTVPTETTIRRTLARLDPETFAAVVGAWLADRDQPGQRRRPAVAVDGKTLRGARRDGRQVHLLAAMDHTTRAVLAQRQVDGAPNEVTGFQPLLAGLDLAGAVVTADALHTHRAAAEFLVAGKHAHYLFIVKANQPALHTRCAWMPWHRVPELNRTRDRGHGRVELRTLMAVTVGGFGFPHAAQVFQVTRKTRDLGARRWRTMTAYAVTSLTHGQASPARLADLIRGHWAIENGLHWVRDVTFDEDASQLRTGTGPHIMACLRNIAIGILSRAGPANLAAALRHHSRDPTRPSRPSGSPGG
jgi:predicted transposase YbfD/YdcC/dihydrofolate reductase